MRAGNWYAFSDVFSLHRLLDDGEQVFDSTHEFEQGRLWLTRYGDALQIKIEDVAGSAVDRLPAAADLASRLLREHVWPVTGASFPWRLALRTDRATYYSRGLVCAELVLHSLGHRASAPTNKLLEVEQAFARGLLDETHVDKATFRLHVRPVIEELRALQQSGYAPACQLNVLFSTWQDDASGNWDVTPLAGCDTFDIFFDPLPRHRGFRISDLFSSQDP